MLKYKGAPSSLTAACVTFSSLRSSISVIDVQEPQTALRPQRRTLDGWVLDVGSHFAQSDGSVLCLKSLTGSEASQLNLSGTHI